VGRPEKPIPPTASTQLRQLAVLLRELRSGAGLTYGALTARSEAGGFSAATLRRAASGTWLPSENVTTAFANACGADPGPALQLRLKAARAAAWADEPDKPRRVSPGEVFSTTDLRTAMRYIHLQAGRPSTRELEAHAPHGHLPHTTLDRVLDPRQRPRLPGAELLEAFLTGCRIPAHRRTAWLTARQRLVNSNARLSACELARRTRPGGRFVPPGRRSWSSCDAVEEAAIRQEENKRFQAFKKSWKDPDDLDYGFDYGTGEDEYTDQRATLS